MNKTEILGNQMKLEARIIMLETDVRVLEHSMDTVLKHLFPPLPPITTADYTADILETIKCNSLCKP